MPYIVEVCPREDRKARIAGEIKNSSRSTSFKFRDQMRELPVVRIPIGLPIYRMKNGRTEDEQAAKLLADPNLPKSFFTAGEENVQPQRVQHDILLEMSKVTTRPIYQVLEKGMMQEEPLLITAAGVVVNGNRRLAAMRDLISRDSATYGSFQHIDAAVLPAEANELDLDEIEVTLQMAVETKLEYTWVNQRLKMRRLMREHHLDDKKVAKLMNYNKASRVNAEIRELELAEEYLERYLHEPPNNYKIVAKGAQIFKEIGQRVSSQLGIEQDLAKAIAFTLVKGTGVIEDRVYDYRQSFGEYTKEVGDRLASALGIQVKQPKPATPTDPSDPLSGLEPPSSPHIEELIARLNDPQNAEKLTQSIVTIHDSIKEADKQDSKRVQALNELRRADTLLASIDVGSLDPKYYLDAHAAIRSGIDHLNDLAGELSGLAVQNKIDLPE